MSATEAPRPVGRPVGSAERTLIEGEIFASMQKAGLSCAAIARYVERTPAQVRHATDRFKERGGSAVTLPPMEGDQP